MNTSAGLRNDEQIQTGQALTTPNLWLQKLSTRQPTLEMLEVSIKAFEAMLAQEEFSA